MTNLRHWLQSWFADTVASAQLARLVERPTQKMGVSGIDQLCDRLSPAATELLEVIIEAVTVPQTKGATVNDDQLSEALAAALTADSPAMMAGPTAVMGLSDVFKRLRALGVPWSKLIALIGPIFAIITSGGTFAEIMAKLLELFFPPAPAPGMVAAAKSP